MFHIEGSLNKAYANNLGVPSSYSNWSMCVLIIEIVGSVGRSEVNVFGLIICQEHTNNISQTIWSYNMQIIATCFDWKLFGWVIADV